MSFEWRDNSVYELSCDYNAYLDRIRQIIADRRRQSLYFIWSPMGDDLIADAMSRRIIEEIERIPEVSRQPIEPELVNLNVIKCIKYKYSPI